MEIGGPVPYDTKPMTISSPIKKAIDEINARLSLLLEAIQLRPRSPAQVSALLQLDTSIQTLQSQVDAVLQDVARKRAEVQEASRELKQNVEELERSVEGLGRDGAGEAKEHMTGGNERAEERSKGQSMNAGKRRRLLSADQFQWHMAPVSDQELDSIPKVLLGNRLTRQRVNDYIDFFNRLLEMQQQLYRPTHDSDGKKKRIGGFSGGFSHGMLQSMLREAGGAFVSDTVIRKKEAQAGTDVGLERLKLGSTEGKSVIMVLRMLGKLEEVRTTQGKLLKLVN